MTVDRHFAQALVACLALLTASVADGQTRPAAMPGKSPPTRPATTQTAPAAQFNPEELEQIVAPVALYPDSLLAQVFMASTYPLEVVQAERWVKQNPKLKDSPEELNKLPWDPSVKSLLDFPQVLTMMSEKLDWTVKLGDAFLADRQTLMSAVQRLRRKAYDKGNLKTTGDQKVTVQDAPAPAGGVGAPAQSSQAIVVESSNPSVVYVPSYNPTVVYGAWPYPAYPPYYYPPPPAYTAGAAMVGFGVGVAVGAAWGHAWGNCNWHGGDVDIDVNRNVNFNGNINRNNYNQINRGAGGAGNRGSWQHNASHRQGVAYRDSATNQRYRGKGASQTAAQSRDAYRGRAEAGRQDLSRGSASAYRGSGSGAAGGGSARSTPQGYRTGGTSGRQSSGSSRDYSGTRSSGFSDSGSSSARTASSRGQSSRSSSSYGSGSGRSGGGYSGGSRSGGYSGGGGGGGARGGGGGRGGGGRR